MRSPRQLKVGEEVRHALAAVFSRGDVPWPRDAGEMPLFTVTEVQMSPDLRSAHAYIMPLGGKDTAAAVKILNGIAGFFRYALGHAVKLRYVPMLYFKPDTSFEYADNIEKLLQNPKVARDLARDEPQDLADSVSDE